MNRFRIAFGAAVVAGLIACGTPTRVDRAIDQPTVGQSTTAPARTPTPGVDPTTAPAKITKTVSVEQENATQAAIEYLDSQGFSRKGLIKQLVFEGYPEKVATAAVGTLKVDWNAQAAIVAKDYLNGEAFSRKGLIGQLEFEGFTHDQAVYGVKAAGL
jgi:hypothetical protein